MLMSWSVRILIGFLLWFLAGMLGFYESHRLKQRVAHLEHLQSVFEVFETEIRFAKSPIQTILERYQDSYPIFKTCYERCQNGADFPSAWTETVERISGLQNEEKRLLLDFGKTFGMTDHSGQLDSCSLMRSHLKRLLEESRYELQKKGKLYRSLGILCGAGIVLIVM